MVTVLARVQRRIVLGLALALALEASGCSGDEPATVPLPAPTKLSAVEAEAELAARAARAFEPAPSPTPKASEGGPREVVPSDDEVLTVGARALDLQARPLAAAALAWLAPPAPGLLPVVRGTARADANGALWLRVPWNDLDSTQPLFLALTAPGCQRQDLVLEPARWMAGPVVSLGEVSLGPGGTLRGRVLDASGAGLGDVLVALSTELGSGASAQKREMARVWPWVEPLGFPNLDPLTRTTPDGAFALEGMPEGTFDLVAVVFGERSALLPDRVEGVVIRAGELATVRDLVLRPAEARELVRGRVLAPDGTPLDGIWIALAQADGMEIYEGRTFTGADGRFALPAMPDTVYRVLARDAQERWPQAQVLDVRPGDAEVEVRLAPK